MKKAIGRLMTVLALVLGAGAAKELNKVGRITNGVLLGILSVFLYPSTSIAAEAWKWPSEEAQEAAFHEIENNGYLQHADLLAECAARYATFNYEAKRTGSSLRADEAYTGDPQKALVTSILMELSSDKENYDPNTALENALSEAQQVYTYYKKEALYDVFDNASINGWDNDQILEYMAVNVRHCVLRSRYLTLRNVIIFDELSSGED